MSRRQNRNRTFGRDAYWRSPIEHNEGVALNKAIRKFGRAASITSRSFGAFVASVKRLADVL